MLKPLTRESASNRPVKVLQFGEGNFLRAFVDWIIDILNEKTDFNGNVMVVQPIEKGMGQMINEQQGLYHVVLNGITDGKPTREIRRVNCLTEVLNPYQDYQAFLALAENPELKFIISNTTEAGIAFNVADASPDKLPESFPGKICVLLYRRFTFFHGSPQSGLTFLPCELIEKNGSNLKSTVLQFVEHWHLPVAFKTWILDHNTFCNTLVDRIVPGFPKETIDEIKNEIGYNDNLVVMAEPFHLWVIEGPKGLSRSFPTEAAGLDVKFVDDMTPYRTRKVRILNGAHTALVPVAYLKGLRTVRESIDHPITAEFIRKLIFEEIIPTLELPPAELSKFADDVIERFQNPYIKHELSSIALNSISKFKVRVLPSLLRYLEIKKQLPERLVHSFAALILFYKGVWQGQPLPVSDTPEIIQFFDKVWKYNDLEKTVNETLANTSFWDHDLSNVKGLKEAVTANIIKLESSVSTAV